MNERQEGACANYRMEDTVGAILKHDGIKRGGHAPSHQEHLWSRVLYETITPDEADEMLVLPPVANADFIERVGAILSEKLYTLRHIWSDRHSDELDTNEGRGIASYQCTTQRCHCLLDLRLPTRDASLATDDVRNELAPRSQADGGETKRVGRIGR
jgi:hypothetical protein